MSSTTESAWASFDEDPKPRNYNRIVIPVGLLLAAGAVAGPYLYRNLYRTPINSTAGADLIPTGLKNLHRFKQARHRKGTANHSHVLGLLLII